MRRMERLTCLTRLMCTGRASWRGSRPSNLIGGDYLIFRTAWVYSLRRESFVTKVLEWARKKELLRVVDDQISNPTWARLLAESTTQILVNGVGCLRERTGLYHLAGGGYATRYAWAQEILKLDPRKQEQIVKQLLPALSVDFPTPAQRPLFSALECRKFEQVFNLRLPPWDAALKLAMDDI